MNVLCKPPCGVTSAQITSEFDQKHARSWLYNVMVKLYYPIGFAFCFRGKAAYEGVRLHTATKDFARSWSMAPFN